jgi:hypothetical protein
MILASPAASQVVPGILGFLVVAGMAVALVLLLWSMNRQLRKVVPGPRWREEAGQGRPPGQDSDLSPNGNQAP